MPNPLLSYCAGTLELRQFSSEQPLPPCLIWDERTACYRAEAMAYAQVVRFLTKAKITFDDQARQYSVLGEGLKVHREPRPFQSEALEAWHGSKGRGVVVLPTGAGKSYLALMAIDRVRRSTLVVAPTLDLVRQWYDQLRIGFGTEVGVIGGGDYKVAPLTVITYDSAHLHMHNIGHRFGLVIFDECHHLPGDSYLFSAKLCLAPYRLGLSATVERTDGRHLDLETLIGPTLFRKDIIEMTGQYLADYDVERITVDLSESEREEYEQEHAIYKRFIARHAIFAGAGGWQNFVIQSSRSDEGRRAMAAYQRQKNLANTAPSKLKVLEELLFMHRNDRAIVFTEDNATAYAISRRFLIPIITHQTKVDERTEILSGLMDGTYAALATSKVLNEGVDVPEANVAIVVSGSGSVREHVQRLGRVLRQKKDGTRATLYELIAGKTSEANVSSRRREHSAYR